MPEDDLRKAFDYSGEIGEYDESGESGEFVDFLDDAGRDIFWFANTTTKMSIIADASQSRVGTASTTGKSGLNSASELNVDSTGETGSQIVGELVLLSLCRRNESSLITETLNRNVWTLTNTFIYFNDLTMIKNDYTDQEYESNLHE